MNDFSVVVKNAVKRQKPEIRRKSLDPMFETSSKIAHQSSPCACGGSCPKCQAKSNDINISNPNDTAEIEADKIADKVMHMPALDSKPIASNSNSINTIHRKHDGYDQEKEDVIQRKDLPSNNNLSAQSPAHVQSAISSGGSPLKPSTRRFFEPRLGHDLGNVRVHNNASAQQSASAVDAKAYTLGNDIVFGHDEYKPEAQSGKHLLAHELAHVIQSGTRKTSANEAGNSCNSIHKPLSGPQVIAEISSPQSHQNSALRIHRKKRPGKNLSILKVTAFQGQNTGEATLSDGTVEPISLATNTLEPGVYTYDYDPAEKYHYRRSDLTLGSGTIRWNYSSVLEGDFVRSEKVTVNIFEGNKASLQAQIDVLPQHIKNFLTTDEGKSGSYEDLHNSANAGLVLESSGVTEDELLLLEQQQKEAKERGQAANDNESPADWATVYTSQRQEAGEKAVTNRQELLDLIRQAENIRDEPNDPSRKNIKATADGVFTEETIGNILIHHNIIYQMLTDRFEIELRAITESFLSQAQVALIRIEKTYLADQNVGAEKERLRKVTDNIRPALTQADKASDNLQGERFDAALNPIKVVETALGKQNSGLKKAEVESDNRTSDLQDQSKAAGFGVVGWKTFDRDIIREKDIDKSRNMLRQFVFSSRTKLQSAEQKVQNIKTLYGADRMIELTKTALGIKDGSVMNDILRARVRAQTADHSFWGTIWDIVTIALMFVPGNIGIALRVGSGLINAANAMDDYSDDVALNDVGLTSNTPSSLGVFLAVGGTLIDANQMAKGVFKVIDTEASLTAKAARTSSAESNIVRQGEGSLTNTADDVVAQEKLAVATTESNVPSLDQPSGPQFPVQKPPIGDEIPPSIEIRGERYADEADHIMVRPSHAAATLTQAEVSALRNTETKLLEQRVLLKNELRQQNSLAQSIGNRADNAIENAANKTDIENLEKAFDAQQQRVNALENKLQDLDDELTHVKARITNEAPPTTQPPQLARGRLRQDEVAEAFNLGPENHRTMISKDPNIDNFKPDHIAGNPKNLSWGEDYHFIEIKDWEKMSDTGNLSAMLDYVDNVNGSLSIYYKSNTKMYEPLINKIEALIKKGKVDLIPFVGE